MRPRWEPCWSCLTFTCANRTSTGNDSQESSTFGPPTVASPPYKNRSEIRAPRALSRKRRSTEDQFKECQRKLTKEAPSLHPCLWNRGRKCDMRYHFHILTYRGIYVQDDNFAPGFANLLFQSVGFLQYQGTEVNYEPWLNKSLTWIRPVRSSRWISEKKESLYKLVTRGTRWYYQRLPTPTDLLSVPDGDFHKLDQCVVLKIVDQLHEKDWTKGTSPRCPLEETIGALSTKWIYNCTSRKKNDTVKGILQAWQEHHARDETKTRWGFNQKEIEQFVVPCLNTSKGFWVKYQYLATVYSKEQDLWPDYARINGGGVDLYASPKPWTMICNTQKRNCTIQLARKPCDSVPRFKDYCKNKYLDKDYASIEGAVWIKNSQNQWIRNEAVNRQYCTRWEKDYGLQETINQGNAQNYIPYKPDPEIQILEGRAFRKSLCEGKEVTGFDWVGFNRIYGQGKCQEPYEHWLSCGHGDSLHECKWYERVGKVLGENIKEIGVALVTTAVEIVKESLDIGSWLLDLAKEIGWWLILGLTIVLAAAIAVALIKRVLQGQPMPWQYKKMGTPLKVNVVDKVYMELHKKWAEPKRKCLTAKDEETKEGAGPVQV
ncbi:uncharacterized protein LOC133473446 [Phyllopteryx taeniolatus]|uniref:uncharacterized protein LOC133473446 n=1 Tax=Phyllopteryx taeniolatus TaxID=161469 RepID=UPI002AD27C15|nr:uncharacterized protein LOC133473446 [Phyllopteryx taeniolatus]XP_061621104.1 uncharacterized protein LOC133473446 [Phyllopteryx taeniolatus]